MPEDSEIIFKNLEKQLAKDALEKALKDLHREITREIERNKTTFSEEIKKTLASFKNNLEQSVAEEIERQLSTLFEKYFNNTSSQVKVSFRELFSPVIEKTKEDMKTLHTQGETTLQAWKDAVSLYTSFWTKPAFIWMFIALFTGILSSLILSYFMTREEREISQTYARALLYHEKTIDWCDEYIKKNKSQEKEPLKTTSPSSNQAQSKKKQK